MPEAAKRFREAQEAEKRGPVMEGRRKRSRVNYKLHDRLDDDEEDEDEEGGAKGKKGKASHHKPPPRPSKDEDYEALDQMGSEEEEEGLGLPVKGARRKSSSSRAPKSYWSKALRTLEETLLLLGPMRWGEVRVRVEASHGPLADPQELESVGGALVRVIHEAAEVGKKVEKKKKGGNPLTLTLVPSALLAPAPAPAAAPAPAPAFTEEDAVQVLVKSVKGFCPPSAMEAMSHPALLKRLVKAGFTLKRHLDDLCLLSQKGFKLNEGSPGGPSYLSALSLQLPEISTTTYPSLPSWWRQYKCDEALLR